MTRPARLIVDPIACDGRGICAELLPELITLDDWGFPIISAADMPARLAAEAAVVVRLCPRLALRLERAGKPPRNPGHGKDQRGALHKLPANPVTPVAHGAGPKVVAGGSLWSPWSRRRAVLR
jgi:ferredoxin